MTHANQPPTVGASVASTTEDDTEVVLPLDLEGLVSLLTRSALPLRSDRPGDRRPTYVATWRVAVASDPAAWAAAVAAGRPVGVRSTVERVTGGVWATGATVDGAVANVERDDGHLHVVVRPPRPVGEPPPPVVVHLPVDLSQLVVAVEVAPDQPDWLRQAVAGAVQAGHHHALPLPGVG